MFLASLPLILFLVLIFPTAVQAVANPPTYTCRYQDGYDLIVGYVSEEEHEYADPLHYIWRGVTYYEDKKPQFYSTSENPTKNVTSLDGQVPFLNSSSKCFNKVEESCFLVSVKDYDQEEYTQFVVRSQDLYILGFKTGENFYSLKEDGASFEPVVPETTKRNLGYNGNYNTIYPEDKRNDEIKVEEIISELSKFKNAKPNGQYNQFKTGIAYAAFFISESLRFQDIYWKFEDIFSGRGSMTFNTDLRPYVLNWGSCSQAYVYGNKEQKEEAARILKTAKGDVPDPGGNVPSCSVE